MILQYLISRVRFSGRDDTEPFGTSARLSEVFKVALATWWSCHCSAALISPDSWNLNFQV